MPRLFIFIVLLGLTSNCGKDNVNPGFSEARYRVSVTGNWTAPSFGLPPGAHYTTFVGMVHNNEVSLWKEGTAASPGMEMLAEIGNGTGLLTEIDSKIAAGKASSLLLFLPPGLTTSVTANIYSNTNFSQVSFGSMLAPTPDWFVGLSGFELYKNGSWVQDTSINLYPYDAGTEDGDVFNTNNPSTSPQQNIHLLSVSQATVLANGNNALGPIATVRFTKQ